MVIAEKLVAARGLLERAREASDAERAWLLALAWGELQEGAEALASVLDTAAPGAERAAVRALAAAPRLAC